MIALTGATGQLGRLVIDHLLTQVPAHDIVAVVRSAAKAADLAARGVSVREATYAEPIALQRAFTGIDRLLLISSSEIGQRTTQHQQVIASARQARVGGVIYTSLLRAATSPLSLAGEHLATEAILQASGVPAIILRNGWYTENHTASIPAALAHGVFVGSAGTGRISWAARTDYAAAAAAALTGRGGIEFGRTYELAGDTAHSLADLAAELSRQSGRTIPYQNLPEATYRDILLKAGLPAPLAGGLAAWDVDASNGALLDESRTLSRLIGRPTTPLAESIKQALGK